jgi:hypothetical protein
VVEAAPEAEQLGVLEAGAVVDLAVQLDVLISHVAHATAGAELELVGALDVEPLRLGRHEEVEVVVGREDVAQARRERSDVGVALEFTQGKAGEVEQPAVLRAVEPLELEPLEVFEGETTLNVGVVERGVEAGRRVAGATVSAPAKRPRESRVVVITARYWVPGKGGAGGDPGGARGWMARSGRRV